MTTLNSRISEHVNALAPPITMDEILTRSVDETPTRSRWPLTLAAASLVVAGVAATVTLVGDRPSIAPADQPDLRAAPMTTSAPASTTPPPAPTIELVVGAGSTIDEIAAQIAATVDTIDEATFVRAAEDAAALSDLVPSQFVSAEGLLASGSYRVAADASAGDIATQMVERMNEIGSEADIVTRGAALGRSPDEILTIASMLEVEANVPGDRGRISRVIHNRLFVTASNPSEPFPLQIDAPVLYGRDRAGLGTDLPFSQLRQIPTDWNTYIVPGLPLTPIATPGRDSIEAALAPTPNPRPTDPICVDLPQPDECFLFFYVLADEDGSMAFAATGEQHEANVERARQLGLL